MVGNLNIEFVKFQIWIQIWKNLNQNFNLDFKICGKMKSEH